jgi:hypothetical protein
MAQSWRDALFALQPGSDEDEDEEEFRPDPEEDDDGGAWDHARGGAVIGGNTSPRAQAGHRNAQQITETVARRTRAHVSLQDKDMAELEDMLADPDLEFGSVSERVGPESALEGAEGGLNPVYADFLMSVLQPLSHATDRVGAGGQNMGNSRIVQAADRSAEEGLSLLHPDEGSLSGFNDNPVAPFTSLFDGDDDDDDEDYVDDLLSARTTPVSAPFVASPAMANAPVPPRPARRMAKWANFSVALSAAAAGTSADAVGLTQIMVLELRCLVRGIIQILIQGLLLGSATGTSWCETAALQSHARECTKELLAIARLAQDAVFAGGLCLPDIPHLDLVGSMLALTRKPGPQAAQALEAAVASSVFEDRWLCRESLDLLRSVAGFSWPQASEKGSRDKLDTDDGVGSDAARPFTRAEDALLELGIRRFVGQTCDWDAIALELLPTRAGEELRRRHLSQAVPHFQSISALVHQGVVDRDVLHSDSDEESD